MILRPYQRTALDGLYAWFQRHPEGNPLVAAAVGAGKSVMIAALCQEAISQWPETRIVMCVPSLELCQQNLDKLMTIWPEAPASVYSAAMGRKELGTAIVYATIGSIYKIAHQLGRVDLLLIDEAHLLGDKETGMFRKLINDLSGYCPDLRVIGWTGTAFRGSGIYLTDQEAPLFHGVAASVTMRHLLDTGYLAPLTTQATATKIATDGVGMRSGDYIVSQLAAVSDQAHLVSSACQEIVTLASERQRWLVFAVTVEHAQHIQQALSDLGIACAVVSGVTPKAERQEAIADFRSGKLRALVNVAVLCLDEKTEILTSCGFVGIDEISREHEIAAWHIDDESIHFERPSCIIKRPRRDDEEMVSIRGNGMSFRVTENHTMVIAHQNYKWKTISAHELVGKKRCLPASGIAKPINIVPEQTSLDDRAIATRIRATSYTYRKAGQTKELARSNAEFAVRQRQAMKYKTPSELTNDECRLIGFWLGDGSISRGQCAISQSMRYSNIIKWLDDVLVSTGITFSRFVRPSSGNLTENVVIWTLSRGTGFGPQKVDGYHSIEPYLNKKGSQLYWGLSQDQFGCLLEGFWYADGNHGNRAYGGPGGIKVVGTQYSLYNILQAVGTCRGYRMILNGPYAGRKANHNEQWSLSWRKASRMYIAKARPQLEQSDPDTNERVWCVTSPTGYIVTRRNGVVTITGNTTGFDVPEVDCIALLRATKSPVLYTQILGRGMRIAPDKADCLVLDFTDTIASLGPVDAIKGRAKPLTKGSAAAPYKVCPECGSHNATAILVCLDCGFEFPPPERINHGVFASNAAVLSSQLAKPNIVRYPVDRVTYHRHVKPGSPDSMRVEYWSGLRVVAKEWVCFEHGGMAGHKAKQWWTRHVADAVITTCDPPQSTAWALEYLHGGETSDGDPYLIPNPPSVIHVNESGKFPEITSFEWAN